MIGQKWTVLIKTFYLKKMQGSNPGDGILSFVSEKTMACSSHSTWESFLEPESFLVHFIFIVQSQSNVQFWVSRLSAWDVIWWNKYFVPEIASKICLFKNNWIRLSVYVILPGSVFKKWSKFVAFFYFVYFIFYKKIFYTNAKHKIRTKKTKYLKIILT